MTRQYLRKFYQHLKQNNFYWNRYFDTNNRAAICRRSVDKKVRWQTFGFRWLTKISPSLFSRTVRRDRQQFFVTRNIHYSIFLWGIIFPLSINMLKMLVSNLEHHSLHGLSTRGITWINIVNYNYIRKFCKSLSKSLVSVSGKPLNILQ